MNGADTAFVLISAALVMLMTPGLAFFYGGMVRVKSTLNMLMMSFISLGVVSVLWVLYGYSLTFGDDIGGGLLGNLDHVGMRGITPETMTGEGGIPVLAFAAFQLMFAIITPALISGALADRVKFGAWALFVALWVTLVYFPVAHWVWGPDGFIGVLGDGIKAIDFAGGTAVHINAGVGALAAVLVVGKRVGFKKDPMRPHNLPFVLLGASLLWFGWFGFNAGSELAADGVAATMLFNTQVATAAAVIGWLIYEKLRHGSVTMLGAASGAIAGLVAITPSGANVNAVGALIIGVVAGSVCAWAVGMKFKLGYDDSLDVVGVHMVGGIIGTLSIGFLAIDDTGLFYGGGFDQLWRQAAGAGTVLVYTFVVTFIIAKAIDMTVGFRVSEDEELAGVDQYQHAESAYDFSGVGSAAAVGPAPGPAPAGVSGGTPDKKAPGPDKKVDA